MLKTENKQFFFNFRRVPIIHHDLYQLEHKINSTLVNLHESNIDSTPFTLKMKYARSLLLAVINNNQVITILLFLTNLLP